MDADGDGKLTLQEFQAAHERIFKAVDTNHDGTVTLEEMQVSFVGTSSKRTGWRTNGPPCGWRKHRTNQLVPRQVRLFSDQSKQKLSMLRQRRDTPASACQQSSEPRDQNHDVTGWRNWSCENFT
jgi:hypothetical protein